MHEDLTGTLTDGKRYRLSSYELAILDGGAVKKSVDLSDFASVERRRERITLSPRKGRDGLSLEAETRDDAGRLERGLIKRGVPRVAASGSGGGRAMLRLLIGLLLAGGVIAVYLETESEVSKSKEMLPEQATQLFTEGLFTQLTIVGLACAAYIASRGGRQPR